MNDAAPRRADPPGAAAAADGVPDDAFISPDEPILRESPGGVPDDAFISPDEPIVRGESAFGGGASVSADEPLWSPRGAEIDLEVDPDEVMVTGIGDDPHLDPEDLAAVERYGDPHVAELVERVARLADALRDRGEAGLRTTPEMSRFEATLRAYCVGYLTGRRESAGRDGY